MIGQHIYTRCTQGYFGRSAGDSTTVTITDGMFPIKEQEAAIARICEKIGVLEDTRKAPETGDTVNRGILKVVRVNDQITVVCRSRRIGGHLLQGARDFRDFTYSDSFILTGREKEQFFDFPGGALRLENYEPYSSLQGRMNAYEKSNSSGYPPVNERYSILNDGAEDLSEVFSELGFTDTLSEQYFYAILFCALNRGSASGTGSRVYVVLPEKFQAERARTGGSLYAEKLLLATYQLLPQFIASVLNGISGGSAASAGFLEPYQLVITDDPVALMYETDSYVINLDRKTSNVRMDGRLEPFIRDLARCMSHRESRAALNQNCQRLTGQAALSRPDQGSLRLLELAVRCTIAPETLQKLSLLEVLDLCASTGPDRSAAVDQLLTQSLQKLESEASSGGAVSREEESALLSMLTGGGLSQGQETSADTILLRSMLRGTGSQESLQRIRDMLDRNPARADRLFSGMSGAMDADACRAETIQAFNEASAKYRRTDVQLSTLLDEQVITWINGRLAKGKVADAIACIDSRARLLPGETVFCDEENEVQLFALLTLALAGDDSSIRKSAGDLFAQQIAVIRPEAREKVWKNFAGEYLKVAGRRKLYPEERYCCILFAVEADMNWAGDVWMRDLFSFESGQENRLETDNLVGLVEILCSQNLWQDSRKDRVRQLDWKLLCRMLSSEKKWFIPSLQELEPLMVPLNTDRRRRDLRLSVLYTRYQAEADKVRFLRTYDGAPQIWEIIFASIWKGEYRNPLTEYATGYCESRDRMIEIYRNTSLIENAEKEPRTIHVLADAYAELYETEWDGEKEAAGPGSVSLAERFWKREQESLNALSPGDPLYRAIVSSLGEWMRQNIHGGQDASGKKGVYGRQSASGMQDSAGEWNIPGKRNIPGKMTQPESTGLATVGEEIDYRHVHSRYSDGTSAAREEEETAGKKKLMAGCAAALAVAVILAIALLLKISGRFGQGNTTATPPQTKVQQLTEAASVKQTETAKGSEKSTGERSTQASTQSTGQSSVQGTGQTSVTSSAQSAGQTSAQSTGQTSAQSTVKTTGQSSSSAGGSVKSTGSKAAGGGLPGVGKAQETATVEERYLP